AALGGVARRGIYDNMKTAVDRVGRGKKRDVNDRFAALCAHYLFDPDFCNVASGWEKGVVEKNVQDSRRRIWLAAREQRFGS
ncbi:IS21 family transposase, partial [Roseateles sp. BYS78W]